MCEQVGTYGQQWLDCISWGTNPHTLTHMHMHMHTHARKCTGEVPLHLARGVDQELARCVFVRMSGHVRM